MGPHNGGRNGVTDGAVGGVTVFANMCGRTSSDTNGRIDRLVGSYGLTAVMLADTRVLSTDTNRGGWRDPTGELDNAVARPGGPVTGGLVAGPRDRTLPGGDGMVNDETVGDRRYDLGAHLPIDRTFLDGVQLCLLSS